MDTPEVPIDPQAAQDALAQVPDARQDAPDCTPIAQIPLRYEPGVADVASDPPIDAQAAQAAIASTIADQERNLDLRGALDWAAILAPGKGGIQGGLARAMLEAGTPLMLDTLMRAGLSRDRRGSEARKAADTWLTHALPKAQAPGVSLQVTASQIIVLVNQAYQKRRLAGPGHAP